MNKAHNMCYIQCEITIPPYNKLASLQCEQKSIAIRVATTSTTCKLHCISCGTSVSVSDTAYQTGTLNPLGFDPEAPTDASNCSVMQTPVQRAGLRSVKERVQCISPSWLKPGVCSICLLFNAGPGNQPLYNCNGQSLRPSCSHLVPQYTRPDNSD